MLICGLELTVLWPRQAVTGLSPHGSGFDSSSFHVKFTVGRLALDHISLPVLRLSSFLHCSILILVLVLAAEEGGESGNLQKSDIVWDAGGSIG